MMLIRTSHLFLRLGCHNLKRKVGGPVRMMTLWSRWARGGGGLVVCRVGGAVVSVVAGQLWWCRFREICARPHQHMLASPARCHAMLTVPLLLTPLDGGHGERAKRWEATERWCRSPRERGEQWRRSLGKEDFF
jgi:hypothetical protein